MAAIAPAQGATSEWTETPGGKVRIILEETGKNGELRGALQIDLNPGWKTYWRNPGDAGVPPQFNLDGGVSARIEFPAPVSLGTGDESGIGYKHPISLPVTFTVNPGTERLKGNAFLGVCQNICIPVQAEFDFPLNAKTSEQSPQAIAASTIVETAFDRLPLPATTEFGVKSAKRHENNAIFEVSAPDFEAPAELFVGSEQFSLSEAKADGFPRQKRFIATLSGKVPDGSLIDYTLVQNGKAVSGHVRLD
ncbi:hypothetical protein M8994_06710 [Brucella sp. 21LCYQ03]|nr:hypothetical protein [Brucella sp. 21LCYQ03]